MDLRYLIVGASSGIGAAVASKLLKENSTIIALSRSKGAIKGAPNTEFHTCDVIDTSVDLPSIEGPIAGLAYLPGTINLKQFQSISEEEYRYDWEVNFLGATRVIKKYLPNLKKSKEGSIVLMSTVAVGQGMAYHTSIASAKGAVEGLTRSLAAELAPIIRVNAVAPSLTSTPLSETLIKDDKSKTLACNRHPMHRIGNPVDIAESVIFLLSDKSSWITGQVLHVDGGLSTIKIF